MKTRSCWLALLLLVQTVSFTHAGALQTANVSSFLGNSCWYEPSAPYTASGTFTLPGVSGTGTVNSSLFYAIQSYSSGGIYTYTLDLSQMSGTTGHCVKLGVYFGDPNGGCNGAQVFCLTNGSQVPVYSATENLSEVYLAFGAGAPGCLTPGQAACSIAMISSAPAKTNRVTIIDDYVNPLNGTTNHYVTYATAIVPDIPPIYLLPLPPWFQGVLQMPMLYPTNPAPAPSGIYDLGMKLYSAVSNGLPIGPLGPMMTQSVTVSNGLINAPMNFDPSAFFGGQRWLSLSVRPAGGNGNFSTLNPPLPISPTPQAIYAYTAGSVADLAPGQAVTSLNGLTDAVSVQAGSGIFLVTNGNALTINAVAGGPSDRNIKTDFSTINPAEVLARLAALPVQSWRYTNELAQVRHIGPMAQDFMQAFRLGTDDKIIGYVDENGVALAAIQGLNQKLQEKAAELEALKQSVAELKRQVQTISEKK